MWSKDWEQFLNKQLPLVENDIYFNEEVSNNN